MVSTPWSFSGDLFFPDNHTWLPILDTGDQASIASVDAALTVTNVTGGGGNYGVYAVDYSSGVDGPSVCVDFNAYGGPIAFPFAGGSCGSIAGATRVRVYVYPRFTSAFPHVLHVDATGTFTSTPPTTAYCAYGSSVNFGAPTAILITLDFVAALAGLLAAPWLLVFLIPAVGLQLDIVVLCQSQRPAVPQLKDLTKWSPADALQFIQAAIWNEFCICNPAPGGSPPPVTPPAVTVTPPPGGTFSIPPATCEEGSICSMLNNLSIQVGALMQQFAAVSPLVTLIQRQKVPFGYIRSTAHAGLSGDGMLTVHGLLGVSIEYTTIPGYLGLEVGTPDRHLYLGRLNFGTEDGWLESVELVPAPTLLLPIDGTVTRIGYSLAGGVVATLTELVREP